MNFELRTTGIFMEQIKELSANAKKLIDGKLDLIKQNPYRFKRIHSKLFNKIFRVRLNLDGKESRLIYIVIEPTVIIACLLERKDEYRDLELMLEKTLKEIS